MRPTFCGFAILIVLGLVGGASGLRPAEASAPLECAPVRDFETWDLWLEEVEGGLGAWQVEIRDLAASTSLVGIEGGEHPAYRDPAHHDPRALQGGHVVLAAFSTATDLPSGRTRVASLHFMTSGPPQWKATLEVAVNGEGADIPAILRLVKRP